MMQLESRANKFAATKAQNRPSPVKRVKIESAKVDFVD
jgi:hypothetical protein